MRITCVVLPIILFFLVLFGELPVELASALQLKNVCVVAFLFLFLFLVYHGTGWLGVLAGLGGTLLIVATVLRGVWLMAKSDSLMIISGLLPLSDAAGYYFGALHLHAGMQPDTWVGRRPLFPAFLAVLLEVNQHNLQWTIATIVAIAGVACFLFARTIRSNLGTVPAVFALLILLIFYSRFIGLTMTENLGLSLGIIALALLWHGAHSPRLGFCWFTGLWLLTCALAARAGAFFVLPMLLIWGAWHSYRKSSRLDLFRVLAAGSAAISAGLALDILLRRVLVPQAMPFGNFSYSLYGVLTGNKGWQQVLRDHPDITDTITRLGDTEGSRKIYGLALDAFHADPLSALSGVLGTWRDFFHYSGHGVFSFISSAELRGAAILLSSLGLANCLFRRSEAPYAMILAMAVGVCLSVPLVPPIDADSMRVYAATIPLTALLVALGAAYVLPTPSTTTAPENHTLQKITCGYGALLVLITVAGSIFIRYTNQPTPHETLSCLDGKESLVVCMSEGSSIRILEDKRLVQSHVPNVRLSDFKNSLLPLRGYRPDVYKTLNDVRAGQEIRPAINLDKEHYGGRLWLISETNTTPIAGVVHVCALPLKRLHGWFSAEEIHIVSSNCS